MTREATPFRPDELARMLDLLSELVARYRVDDLCLTYCNRAWAAQFRADPSELIGTPMDRLLNDGEMAGLRAQLARLGPDDPYLPDTQARPASTAPGRWIEWADRYLQLPGGAEVLAVGRDVTERHLAEERLAASETLFRSLAEASRDLVWRLTSEPAPHLSYLSPAVLALTGWHPEDLLGDVARVAAVLDEHGREVLAKAVRGVHPPERFDLRMRRPDESWVTLEMQVTPLPDGFQGIGRDVTEIRRLQDDLAALALRDPLTGIANRRLLAVLLESALARTARDGSAVVLSYIDLDDFKQVNDVHGHDAGDAVLLEVARRLRANARGGDVVARLGGDEFVVMHEAEPDTTGPIVERLAEALRPPYELPNGSQVICRPSIGAADSVRHPSRADLMSAADAAMYADKRAARAGARTDDGEDREESAS